jgi:hypothetical protein
MGKHGWAYLITDLLNGAFVLAAIANRCVELFSCFCVNGLLFIGIVDTV